MFNRPLLLASLLAISAHSVDAATLHPAKVAYQVTYKGLKASGTMNLASQGTDHWIYTLSAGNSLATLSQATTFIEKESRLIPLGGSDKSDYTLKKQSVTTHYDWSKNEVHWSGDIKESRRGPVRLQPGDMDSLLINLALVRDITSGKPAIYRMVENGKAKIVAYKVAGREKLSIAGRLLDTTRVVQAGGNKITIAWVAAGVPFPVRIVQREGNKVVASLSLTSLG